jgi:hypothetical protein
MARSGETRDDSHVDATGCYRPLQAADERVDVEGQPDVAPHHFFVDEIRATWGCPWSTMSTFADGDHLAISSRKIQGISVVDPHASSSQDALVIVTNAKRRSPDNRTGSQAAASLTLIGEWCWAIMSTLQPPCRPLRPVPHRFR